MYVRLACFCNGPRFQLHPEGMSSDRRRKQRQFPPSAAEWGRGGTQTIEFRPARGLQPRPDCHGHGGENRRPPSRPAIDGAICQVFLPPDMQQSRPEQLFYIVFKKYWTFSPRGSTIFSKKFVFQLGIRAVRSASNRFLLSPNDVCICYSPARNPTGGIPLWA